MNLGSLELQWVRYVPEWKGNRSLSPDLQLSVELRLLRLLDGLIDPTDQELEQWRDQHMQEWLKKPELAERLSTGSIEPIRICKRLTEQTRTWRNFCFDGKEVHNPIAIFFALPNPMGNNQAHSLLKELFDAQSVLSEMVEDELKNWCSEHCGEIVETNVSSVPTTESRHDASTASAKIASAS